MIFPMVMIAVCLLMGGGVLVYTKLSEKKKALSKKAADSVTLTSANEFVNVKDIRGKFLYTRDGLALCYLKILPISIE